MADYPKWHDVAEHVPLALVHHEIDALRARLDAAGIPQIQVCDTETPCDGSGSEKYGASDWTAAGQDAEGFPVPKDSPEDVTEPVHADENHEG